MEKNVIHWRISLVVVYFAQPAARYRNQTSQAESYYRHAAQLVPSNGWYLPVFTCSSTPLIFENKNESIKNDFFSPLRSTLQSAGHISLLQRRPPYNNLLLLQEHCCQVPISCCLHQPTESSFQGPWKVRMSYIYRIIVFCSHYPVHVWNQCLIPLRLFNPQPRWGQNKMERVWFH